MSSILLGEVPRPEYFDTHDWITTTEAAQILGITKSGLYLAKLRGKFSWFKSGRDYYLSRESVAHYKLNRNKPRVVYHPGLKEDK